MFARAEARTASEERSAVKDVAARAVWPLLHSAAIVLAAALFLFPFTRLLRRVGDEGIIVYGAQRVSQGAVPYRDFLEMLGPASFYWLGSFFKVFGDSWQVARGHLLLTGVAIGLFTWLIARRTVGGVAALPPFLFALILDLPLWPASSHHWDSNLFALLAVFCYLHREGRHGRLWLIATGFLCGVTACFMPQKGIYLAAALIAVLFLEKGRVSNRRNALHSAGWLTASFAALGCMVILAFQAAGALPQFIYANLTWPLTSYSRINDVPYGFCLLSTAWGPRVSVLRYLPSVFSLPLALLGVAPFLFIAILPLLAAILTAVYLRGPKTRQVLRSGPSLTLLLAGMALWMSEIHRRDVFHLVYGSPLLLLAVYALAGRSRARAVVSAVLVGGLAMTAAGRLAACRAGARTETRRGPVLTPARDEALEFLNKDVARGEYVFVYPYYPLYYYLADVRNPIPFGAIVSNINTSADFDEATRDLQAKRVPYVLWDTVVGGANLRRWFPRDGPPSAGELNLQRYLGAAYEEIATKNGFRVLRRKPSYTEH
jgi:cell shape-determining protein MreD